MSATRNRTASGACSVRLTTGQLLHAYLPVGRLVTLEAALRTAIELTTVLPVTAADVLAPRDLFHLAVGARAGARQGFSFDRALVAAWRS